MRWPWQEREELPAARRFAGLLDEILADYWQAADQHRRRLEELREALKDA